MVFKNVEVWGDKRIEKTQHYFHFTACSSGSTFPQVSNLKTGFITQDNLKFSSLLTAGQGKGRTCAGHLENLWRSQGRLWSAGLCPLLHKTICVQKAFASFLCPFQVLLTKWFQLHLLPCSWKRNKTRATSFPLEIFPLLPEMLTNSIQF